MGQHGHPPRVETATGTLRAFRRSDAESLLAAFADPEIARWNPGPDGPEPVTAFIAARNDWSDGGHASWAITDVADRLVGSVSLYKIDREQLDAEIGYWVSPAARGRGHAAAAVVAATRFGFAELGLHRVHLYHSVANPGSCAVARSAGFRLEGTLRQSFRYADGAFHDEHLHARLSDDP